MKNRLRRLAAGVAIAVVSTSGIGVGTAFAAPSYSYVTDVTTGAPGSTFSVFLRETLGPGDVSVIVADGGLFGAGFSVRYLGGRGPLPIVAVAGNPALFGGSFVSSLSPTEASVLQSISIEALSGALPDANGLILLGSFTVSSNASGLPAAFMLSRLDAIGGNTITLEATDLDFDSVDPAFSGATGASYPSVFTTVPEPAGAGVLAMAAVLLGGRRGR